LTYQCREHGGQDRVRIGDHERAHVILRDIESAGSGRDDVICGGCGEPSPANFELCWNCGTSL
jgi:predicted amidophosphoribosyltransferase